MSVTQQQVVSLLENVLFENAAQATADAAVWQANPAAGSVATLATAMAASPEASIAAHVVGYYLTSLGRAPTGDEVRYYVAVAEQGLTQSQIAAGQVSDATWNTIASYFTASAEFSTRAGLDYSLGTTGALLEAVPYLYKSVLGRTPSSAEISYYDNQVLAGTGINLLFREFTASPEFHTDTDAQIANALASYGSNTVNGLQPPLVAATVQVGPPSTTTPVTPPPTPPAPTFSTLTSSTDTIDDSALSGAHTYHAVIGTGATLNAADHMNGNGLGTLALTNSDIGGALVWPGAAISGVPAITLTTSEDAGSGGSRFYLASSVTDLTHFTLNASGTNGDYIRVGLSATAVNVDVTATTASGVFDILSGAKSLDLTDNALTQLDIAGNIVNGVTLHTTSTSATISLNASTALSINDADAHITSLIFTGPGSPSTISAVTDSALTTLSTAPGSQFVTFGSSTSARFSLGGAVAAVNLATDSATGAGNFLLVNSDNIAIALGNNKNDIDLNSHTGATVTVGAEASYNAGTPAANLILYNAVPGTVINLAASPSGLTIDPSPAIINDPTVLADLITALNNAATPGQIEYGDDGVNTYIVESNNGSASSGHVTIIGIMGVHGIDASAGTHITLT